MKVSRRPTLFFQFYDTLKVNESVVHVKVCGMDMLCVRIQSCSLLSFCFEAIKYGGDVVYKIIFIHEEFILITNLL